MKKSNKEICKILDAFGTHCKRSERAINIEREIESFKLENGLFDPENITNPFDELFGDVLPILNDLTIIRHGK